MSKRYIPYLLTLLGFFYASYSYAQVTQYAIGSSGNELATCVRYMPSDNSTIIAGYSYDYDASSGSASNYQILLLKVSSGGGIVWQKTFGVASDVNAINSMIITHDSNIVAVGFVGGTPGDIYSGNNAAIFKFNGADGSLMWQKCFTDAATTVGGERFNSVTELSDGRLVAVGAHNFTPDGSGSMVCVFQSDGTFSYGEVYDVSSGDEFNSVCTSSDGTSVYMCGEFVGTYKDGRVMSYTPGTTSGTVNWENYYDFSLYGTLNNNFFDQILLSGSKLIVLTASLNGYSTAGGVGEALMTLNASDGSGAVLTGIQNSGDSYANMPKMTDVSSDHVFNVQSPGTSAYDPVIYSSGISSDAVVTDVTSISSATATTPIKFTTADVGLHSVFDLVLQNSTLYCAGATNVSSGYGNNDIYYIVTDTTFSSTTHSCDTVHDTVALVSTTYTNPSTSYSVSNFTPSYITLDINVPDLRIKKLCGDAPVDSGTCFVNALHINTGYDPVSGTAITPGTDGGAGVPDPKWIVTAATSTIPGALSPGSHADIIAPPSPWAVNPSTDPGGWISCINSSGFSTDGGTTAYYTTLSRPFKMCSADSITFNLNIAADNYVSSVDVDGTPFPFSESAGESASYYDMFTNVTKTFYLPAGTHNINVVLNNYNVPDITDFNPMGLDVWGTVSSATGDLSLMSEIDTTCTCSSSLCNTVNLPDTIHACKNSTATLTATLSGTDSVISISWNPHTGLSDTGSLSTAASVGTTSGYYYITVESLIPGNLVVNGDFSLGDTGFTSSYTHVSGSGSLYPESTFAISHDPHDEHPGAVSFYDHTSGTSSGYMMAVNGASTPIDVWCETISVIPNTYYDFSAWFANWSTADVGSAVPVIQFEVNGVLLDTLLPLTSSPGTWVNFFATWYSDTNTTATICISDQCTVAGGNDFAMDDISFSQLCIAKDSVYLKVSNFTPHVTDSVEPCGGVVVFNITDTAASAVSSYGWTFGDGSTGSGHPISHSYADTGTYTATVIETDSYGCSDTTTKSVDVASIGTITVTISHDTSICKGNSVDLSATGGVSYSWSPGAGLSSTTIANPVATPTITTTYTVSVTSGAGCVATDSVTISVNTLAITVSNDTAICLGLSAPLSASGGTTYSWSPSAGLSDASISDPVATPTVTTTYTVSVTNAAGCSGIDSVTVSVAPDTLHIGISSDTTICAGSSVSLNASGGATYSWSPAAGLSDAAISDPVATPGATTTYVVTGTAATGCSGKDSVTISVIHGTGQITSASDTSVCLGLFVKLNASGGASYSWSPATGLSDPSIANPVATPTTTTTYVVTITDTDGCTAKDSATVTITTGTVHIFASNDTSVCHGLSVQLTASGGVSYSWTPATWLSNAFIANPVAKPEITTTYIVTGKDEVGCVGFDSVTITITPGPQLLLSSPGTVTCDNSSVQLSVSGAQRYYWQPAGLCDNPDIANPTVTPDENTVFIVTGVDGEGCTSIDSVEVMVIKDGSVIIPNAFTPNGDGVNDIIYPTVFCNFVFESFSVYNRWGQRVFYTTKLNDGWDGKFNNVPQAMDVFDYMVRGHNATTNEPMLYKGNITLIR